MRTCAVCRTIAAPTELIRLGWEQSRGLYVGAGPGRGVWCCGADSCVAALDDRRLARGLRRELDAREVDAARTRVREAAVRIVRD